MNFIEALEHVLKHEGGFVNHPSDPGGMTNLGVTRAVWEEWVGRESNEKEMRALTPADVSTLYKRKYWDACRCDDLPSGVDYLVFDMAVNSGAGRSAKMLQKILGVTQDGAIGPLTIAAAQHKNSMTLIDEFSQARIDFYRSLPTFGTFGNGWLNRVEHSKASALLME